MSWAPNDLLTDLDLLAYEPKILSQFGKVEWAALRAKTLEDWLWPQVQGAGFDPQRFRTRFAPAEVLIDANGVFADVTTAATDATADDLALATVFSASTTRLCVGSDAPFRGLSVRLADTVNATAGALSVALWRDAWQGVAVDDRTQATLGVPFSRGGSITWALPDDWVVRSVSGSEARYWARLVVTPAPAAGAIGQLSVIRRSRLCGAVACWTLSRIYRTAPLTQDGPWDRKADDYAQLATDMLQRALPLLGGEFDTQTEDDVVDATEAAQTANEARGSSGWTFERA